MLTNGLKWISKNIEDKIDGNESVVIDLVEVELAEIDFQPEAFYYGIAK